MEETRSAMESSDNSQMYFRSYGDVSVHELMLKDRPRTLAYKDFVNKNKHLFEGKVVLDVGAGTGILSLFCASAGAAQVLAVEASEMADFCEQIVEKNQMQDKICVLKGRVEEVSLPVDKVDVIISEWMGFYLLHESMLDSVLYARDRYLADSGIMVPSSAALYAAPVNMSKYMTEHFGYWEDVYGYDFSPLQAVSMATALQQPIVDYIKPEQCLNEAQTVVEFDLKTVKLDEIQSFKAKLSFEMANSGVVHGFATWFDVFFVGPVSSEPDFTSQNRFRTTLVTLSTSPFAPETHWKQTVILLPVSAPFEAGDTIKCQVEMAQDRTNKRHYNISLETMENGGDGSDNNESVEEEEEEESEEDTSGHQLPCDCGAPRCRLIKALMEKYDEEQDELQNEAEIIDVTAEVEAAKTVDMEIMSNNDDIGECGGS